MRKTGFYVEEECFCWRASHAFLVCIPSALESVVFYVGLVCEYSELWLQAVGIMRIFCYLGLLRILLVTERMCSNKNSWAFLATPSVFGMVGVIHLDELDKSLTPLLYLLKCLSSFANKVTNVSAFLRDNVCWMCIVLKLPLNNLLHLFSKNSHNWVCG